MDYLSRFDFDITYIKGYLNKVADCLSRYYESDTMANVYQPHNYVQADIRIDPSGEDLHDQCYREAMSKVIELQAIHDTELRRSKCLQEQQESHDLEAKLMEEANQHINDNIAKEASPPSVSEKLLEGPSPSSYGDDLTLAEALFERTSDATPTTWGSEEFTRQI